MDTAFFHDDSKPRTWRKLVVPFRRAVRRLQRPYYVRLQHLLMQCWHADRARHAEIEQLRHELDTTRQMVTKLEKSLRAMRMDQAATARRLAGWDDHSATSEPRILPMRHAA